MTSLEKYIEYGFNCLLTQTDINNISDSINKSNTLITKAYRGINVESFDYNIGDIYTSEEAFMSFTLSKTIALDFADGIGISVVFTINNSNGLDISDTNPTEAEVLILGNFTITNINTIDGVIYVTLSHIKNTITNNFNFKEMLQMDKLQQRFLNILKENNTSVEKHCVNTSCLYCKYYKHNNANGCPLALLKEEARKESYRKMRKELEEESKIKTKAIIKIDENESFGGYIGRIVNEDLCTLSLLTDMDDCIWNGGCCYASKDKQYIINLLFTDADIFNINIVDIVDSTIQHSLLDDMENNKINVYDICIANWIVIKKQYLTKYCYRDFTDQDLLECNLFHKEQVYRALLKNIEVSEFVLSDYEESLQDKAKQEIEKIKQIESEKSLLSSTDLEIGDKLILENIKVTFIKQDENDLYFRIYKKHKKCFVIKNNTMIKHTIGW